MIAIVGPTAVGKSDVALHLAQYFPLEIIGADSRQVYRYMDIGTNKPSLADRASVPHHVIDVVDPDQGFSLAVYHQLALEASKTIRQKGKLPLLVGGSGLYVWSLIEKWKIPQVPPDREMRRRLESRAEQGDSQSLYRDLKAIDPAAAAKIDPRNIRRVIRALEIYYATGQPPSQLQRKEVPRLSGLIIGFTQERVQLYRRIDSRVDRMIQRGLVEEVEQLLKKGYDPSLPSMSGMGYRQIGQFLRGEMTLPEAIDRMKYETHRLARHQYAWFRLNDSRIHWFDVGGTEREASIVALNEVRGLIEGFMS
ncbi:MAG: tRNA (adenosine(37)-N6)-dimethylallyltransferase MiaA [Dehalococcoidia bacterium]|nr:tRNA (adenosine(37)-N6)-dimethylallyltransferase MiaA [Dehalococcoidia bacterium]MDH4299340.1 tRNA (adenosine(37)-N6)-dimethylallyltransferase MiaA [Dehalococcoidia bacterium]MDH4366914.1 tRNA (adenosine(37)-N6)-dimethylallyltransferase MiaA [Dehalococcoidia bacterium]